MQPWLAPLDADGKAAWLNSDAGGFRQRFPASGGDPKLSV